MKKSIREYTKFVAERLGQDIDEVEADNIMMSFGFEYNQKVEVR